MSRRWEKQSHVSAVIGKEQQSLLFARIGGDWEFCGLYNVHALSVLRHHMECSYFCIYTEWSCLMLIFCEIASV